MAGGLTGGEEAARAIMTTDTVPKQVALHHSIESGENWTVGGMAKGAGMLAPSLATMLCRADHRRGRRCRRAGRRAAPGHRHDLRPARRRRQLLDQRHRAAAGLGCQRDHAQPGRSRRRGAAGLRRPVRAAAGRRRGRHQAGRDHRHRCRRPRTTRSPRPGSIARDSLVKTALFGSDPNWGRVLAAVGMAPVELDPNRITVSFNGFPVCVDGAGAPGARDVDLSGADIDVTVDLGARRRRRRPSAPPTCRTPTSKRTRPTAHDR